MIPTFDGIIIYRYYEGISTIINLAICLGNKLVT